MKQLSAPLDVEALIVEATRYLAVVEVFRAEHCEPTWQPELLAGDSVRPRGPSRASGARRSRTPRG